jgi:ubiquinone/menaquinone biosynthesis C-methylase UbiE
MRQHDSIIAGQCEFDMLADEYYDATSHPTCSNFRTASKVVLSKWMAQYPISGPVCEVGSGASLFASFRSDLGHDLSSVTLIDASSRMLEHSRPYARLGAELKVANAEDLPLADSSQSALVSILGDPYNIPEFWDEVARVLRPGGLVLFTTPSIEWSSEFRKNLPEHLQNKAEFVTRNGRHVWINSIVHSRTEQTRIIQNAGLAWVATESVTIADLAHQKLSRKLDVLTDLQQPIVIAYTARKPHSEPTPPVDQMMP